MVSQKFVHPLVWVQMVGIAAAICSRAAAAPAFLDLGEFSVRGPMIEQYGSAR